MRLKTVTPFQGNFQCTDPFLPAWFEDLSVTKFAYLMSNGFGLVLCSRISWQAVQSIYI